MADKENGKILNRRFTNKVQEEVNAHFGTDNKVRVSMSYEKSNCNEINFYLSEDRSYQVPGLMGGHTEYIDSELYTAVRFPKGEKIDAEKIREDAEKVMKANARTAYKYSEGLYNYKKYCEKYETALAEFKRICGEINPLFWESQVFVYDSTCRAWEDEREKYLNS